ncbi:MAG: glycosyltransferase family 39 protein [Putridiphycobacter sp.]|nr:glycosyltransferase family 39 protein [Putridiphycobacter sp.]
MDKVYTYINKHRWLEWLLFAVCFWLVIVHLHLNRGLDDMIPGYHYWRKTDTYAQILNYYYNGFNFFDHGLYFNQMESGGKAVAEFPLYYYLIALQLKLFGNHLLILKINWLIVMFAGQFALYKIGVYYLKNHVLALMVPFILFLSPTYVIYTIEFLPDPIALHLSFVGLYFLVKYHQKKAGRWLIWALVFITISGMMKPFYLIPFIAYFLVRFIKARLKKVEMIKLWPFLIPFGFVVLWFLYMNWYNEKYGSHYFLSKLMPIWKNGGSEADTIWQRMQDKWLDTYFHPVYLNILLGAMVVGIIWSGVKQKINGLYTVIALLGAMAYFVLLFGMLNQHDYYIFPVLFMAPLIVLVFFTNVAVIKWSPLFNYGIGIIALILMYQNMHFSWLERQSRLRHKFINATYEFEPYRHLESFLTKNQVTKNDLVIAFSDKSPSYALLLLDRKGWSGFQTFYRREKVTDLMDLGAKYLIVNEALPKKRDSVALEGINITYVADTNQVFIYKLTK